MAQLDKALHYGCNDWGFESLQVHMGNKPVYNDVELLSIDCKPVDIYSKEGTCIHIFKNNDVPLLKYLYCNDTGKWFCENKDIANLTLQMLLEGTKTKNYEQINSIMDYYGSGIYPNVGYDTSTISFTSLSEFFPQMFDLFCEVINNPRFDNRRLEHIKTLAIQDIKIADSNVKVVANKTFRSAIFGASHPYGWSSTEQSVDNVTIDDVKDYYEYYISALPRLIVAGDINDNIVDTIKIANDHNLSKNYVVQHNVPDVETQVIHIERQTEQAYLCIGAQSLAINSPDYLLLSCCVSFLGGYFGSRLMANIREKHGYTYGIYSALVPHRYGSYLIIGASIKKENYNNVLVEIDNEIKRLQNELVPTDELSKFKRYMVGNLLCSLSLPFMELNIFCKIKALGVGMDFYNKILSTIKGLTAQQIQYVAQRYLDISKMTKVLVG